MKTNRISRKSLDEMIDEHIGIEGTKERETFEEKLRLDISGQTIKKNKRGKELNARATWQISWSKESSKFKNWESPHRCQG